MGWVSFYSLAQGDRVFRPVLPLHDVRKWQQKWLPGLQFFFLADGYFQWQLFNNESENKRMTPLFWYFRIQRFICQKFVFRWEMDLPSQVYSRVCNLLRIAKTYSTPYHPQANGLVEWCNYTLLAMLRAVVSEQQDDWDDQLLAFNSKVQCLLPSCQWCCILGQGC